MAPGLALNTAGCHRVFANTGTKKFANTVTGNTAGMTVTVNITEVAGTDQEKDRGSKVVVGKIVVMDVVMKDEVMTVGAEKDVEANIAGMTMVAKAVVATGIKNC